MGDELRRRRAHEFYLAVVTLLAESTIERATTGVIRSVQVESRGRSPC
jgi:hypothetical protein